ncbi:MAG: hypothetical protein AAF992_14810, partial [Bacteroidota bacterium]
QQVAACEVPIKISIQLTMPDDLSIFNEFHMEYPNYLSGKIDVYPFFVNERSGLVMSWIYDHQKMSDKQLRIEDVSLDYIEFLASQNIEGKIKGLIEIDHSFIPINAYELYKNLSSL